MAIPRVEACPVCISTIKTEIVPVTGSTLGYFCARCGEYKITSSAESIMMNKQWSERQRANASGYVRENQGIVISGGDIERFGGIKTPTVTYRADKLLKQLALLLPKPGEHFKNDFVKTDELLGITWSPNYEEVSYLFWHFLEKRAFVVREGEVAFVISSNGWEHLEKMEQTNPDSNIGFIAMSFNPNNPILRPLSDQVIERAIAEAGYEPKRVDKHEHVNRIDDEIISLIKQSKFVIADFTEQKHGVYFESGFALGLNLPVIWMCKKDELENNEIHFDTRQYNYIAWEEDKFDEAKESLRKRIEAIVGKGTYTTTA